jgi:hypothetical protein
MPRIFVDLDGVLADFDAGVMRVTGVWPDQYQQLHGSAGFWRKLQMTPGFYEHLDWMPEGRALWDVVKESMPPPIILTGLPLGDWAEPQKRAWVQRELPGVPVICCMSGDKAKYCVDGDVLIDDRAEARDPWFAAGGLFVQHVDLQSTLEQLAIIQRERNL